MDQSNNNPASPPPNGAGYPPTPNNQSPNVATPVITQVPPPTPTSGAIINNQPTDPPQDTNPNSAFALILQLSTYIFWSLCALCASWLASVVIDASASNSRQVYIGLFGYNYPLILSLISLGFALITDYFYAKHEPTKKVGGTRMIMFLNILLLAIINLGAVIMFAFGILNGGNLGIVGVLPNLTILAIWILVLIRTTSGSKPRLRLATKIIFCAIILGLATLGAFNTVNNNKKDALIDRALPELTSNIGNYTEKNNQLPHSLSDTLSYNQNVDGSTADLRKALNQNLITYKPNTFPAEDESDSEHLYTAKRFYYQLCANYDDEYKRSNYDVSLGLGFNSIASYTTDGSVGTIRDYRDSAILDNTEHPAGNVCYNLVAEFIE